MIQCDLDRESIPAEIAQAKFDCILYPDVLEHLREPWQVVDDHLNLLQPGGMMIASIPNIRHYSTVINLLVRGDWTYKKMGIMDKSHIRFFTKKTMEELFTREKLKVTLIKPRSLSGSPIIKNLNQALFNVFTDFLTVQYLICAQKISD